MSKKCGICGAEALYGIKDTNDYYCRECAEENFSDLTLLITLEQEAQQLQGDLQEEQDAENVNH